MQPPGQAPEEELSEEDRLNRALAYEPPTTVAGPEEQAREEECERIEEARDPELLARDEDERLEEFFRGENALKVEEQKDYLRDQDQQREEFFRDQEDERQKEIFDEAGREKEEQERQAAEQKDERDREIREEDERKKEEQEREAREKAEREREEYEENERERKRESEEQQVKDVLWGAEKSMRALEQQCLRDFQNEARAKLNQYREETGRPVDLFQQQQEERFARSFSQLQERQENRWAGTERRIEDAYKYNSNVNTEVLQRDELEKLGRNSVDQTDLERARETQQRAADWKEQVMEHELPIRAELLQDQKREAFKAAEAEAWKKEQEQREREHKQLQEVQGYARDAIRDRYANDPEQLKEMEQKQQKTIEKQNKDQQEWQEKRWREEQQKLAEKHQIELEARAEQMRQDAIRRAMQQPPPTF